MNPLVAGIVVAAILSAGMISSNSKHKEPVSDKTPVQKPTMHVSIPLQEIENVENLILAHATLNEIYTEISRPPYHKRGNWQKIIFPSDTPGTYPLDKGDGMQDYNIKVTHKTADYFLEHLNPIWYDILNFIILKPGIITKESDLIVVNQFYTFWNNHPIKPLILKDIIRKLQLVVNFRGGKRTRRSRK